MFPHRLQGHLREYAPQIRARQIRILVFHQRLNRQHPALAQPFLGYFAEDRPFGPGMIREKTQVGRGRRTRPAHTARNPGSSTLHELLQHVGIVRLFHPARLTESGAAQIFQRRLPIGVSGFP